MVRAVSHDSTSQDSETAEQQFRDGLLAGFLSASNGAPEPITDHSNPYLTGVRCGHAAWRREIDSAVVDVEAVRECVRCER